MMYPMPDGRMMPAGQPMMMYAPQAHAQPWGAPPSAPGAMPWTGVAPAPAASWAAQTAAHQQQAHQRALPPQRAPPWRVGGAAPAPPPPPAAPAPPPGATHASPRPARRAPRRPRARLLVRPFPSDRVRPTLRAFGPLEDERGGAPAPRILQARQGRHVPDRRRDPRGETRRRRVPPRGRAAIPRRAR